MGKLAHIPSVFVVVFDTISMIAQAIQQLPEYGMFFHHAVCQKMLSSGELLLGVCAKGIVVYEVKNNTHTKRFTFHWRETINIFASVSPPQKKPGHAKDVDKTIIKTL